MALSTAIQWEVRTTGADTNGGGFKAGASGTDRSQSDTPYDSGTAMEAHATINTKVKPVGSTSVAAADVGNLVNIASGTDWTPGVYEITAQDGTYWTLDRSPSAAGNANKATWAMGGALATPGYCAGKTVSGNKIWLKAGTYAITSASANVAGGVVSLGTSTNPTHMEGYQSTRGDRGSRPLLQASGISTCTLISIVGRYSNLVNVNVDGASLTAICGIGTTEYYQRIVLCDAINCTNKGISCGGSGNTALCKVTGCSGAYALVVTGQDIFGCEVYGNTAGGISLTTGCSATRCLAYGNTGGAQISGSCIFECDAYGGDGIGISCASGLCVNCHSEGNATYGFSGDSNTILIGCSAYNNSSGAYNSSISLYNRIGFVAVTDGSVFVDAANADFRLNATANRGALLRGAGYPQTFPRGLSASRPDIGAVQHADPVIAGTAAAGSLYNGKTVTSDGVAILIGTLRASNISGADAANGGEDLSAGILGSGHTVDGIAGSLAGSVIIVEDD